MRHTFNEVGLTFTKRFRCACGRRLTSGGEKSWRVKTSRASAPPVVKDHSIKTWFASPRLRHSEKPEAAREIIQRLFDGPYAELFARKHTVGWDCFGDQLPSGQDML